MPVVQLHYLALGRDRLREVVLAVKDVVAEEFSCAKAPLTPQDVRVLVVGDQGVDPDATFNVHLNLKVSATSNSRLHWDNRVERVQTRLEGMFPDLKFEFFNELCERAIWGETSGASH